MDHRHEDPFRISPDLTINVYKSHSAPMKLRDNKKEIIEDQEFIEDLHDSDLSRKELSRVYAVDKIFTRVAFKQCVFVSCYFRNCKFVRCDFTGASIKESNFKGSQFEECNFKYTIWEKTQLDQRFLDTCLPSEENLARDLVRSLRVNFAQVGNYEAVNKAASIEVRLTGQHLYNAAYSRQAYYRAKYRGYARFMHALQHAQWQSLEPAMGQWREHPSCHYFGSSYHLIASILYMHGTTGVPFTGAFVETFGHFWGVQYRAPMPPNFVVVLTVLRFVLFGLFMAILVKRLSRR